MKKLVKTKRERKIPKVVVVLVPVIVIRHDPCDNSIGGPNDYAYGM